MLNIWWQRPKSTFERLMEQNMFWKIAANLDRPPRNIYQICQMTDSNKTWSLKVWMGWFERVCENFERVGGQGLPITHWHGLGWVGLPALAALRPPLHNIITIRILVLSSSIIIIITRPLQLLLLSLSLGRPSLLALSATRPPLQCRSCSSRKEASVTICSESYWST